ncbi:MAG: hypothetical protein AB7S41_10740 [Parvibaculaceae bacterium]
MQITLDHDCALVLFDVLARWLEDQNGKNITIDHPGELAALQDLLCEFEGPLSEPFLADYDVRVASAREALGKRYEEFPDIVASFSRGENDAD